ncbi:TetR/AcrR family transcriptional regulator [Leptospira sp. 96542]|nr:TetR/AcrR family transcriptional regulator [Leptospira sp. 96542]
MNIPLKKKKISKTQPKSESDRAETGYHHGNLREAVLLRSRRVLEEKGSFALSLRDIAVDLGVSHTAPYRHFPKKIDLLYALVTEGFLELKQGMERAWAKSEDPLEKLRAAGEEYIYLLLGHPRRTELMFGGEVFLSGSLPKELIEAGEEAYLGMYRIVELGQTSLKLKKAIPTRTLMMAHWSCVHGFAVLNERRWKLLKTEEDRSLFQKEIDGILDIMIEGTRL